MKLHHKWVAFFLAVMLLGVGVVAAQNTVDDDWRANADGSMEYNCGVFTDLLVKDNSAQLSANADQIVARTNTAEGLTLQDFIGNQVMLILADDANGSIDFDRLFADPQSVCSATQDDSETSSVERVNQFIVVVSGNVNLRACPGTDCDIVGSANDGSMLTVIGISGDWYQIEHEDGTAFVASRLTTRGPDAVISTEGGFLDRRTNCFVSFDMSRGDMNINIIILGRRMDDVLVDLYRPNESRPLPVEGQFDKTFIDTDEPYIQQYYQFDTGWPLGTYQLEISLNDNSSRLAWELTTRGDHNVFVECL